MALLNPFNNPFMVGFDEIENILLQISKGADSFPPYNIECMASDKLRITLAVAGYQESQIEVFIDNNQLIIKAVQSNAQPRQFLHRGIAGRAFTKSFILSKELQIQEAFLENGLLHIDLNRVIVDKNIKKIPIHTKNSDKTQLSQKKGEL